MQVTRLTGKDDKAQIRQSRDGSPKGLRGKMSWDWGGFHSVVIYLIYTVPFPYLGSQGAYNFIQT